MIRTVAGDDLLPARVKAGDLHRIFDGVRPANCEEALSEAIRRNFFKHLTQAAARHCRDSRVGVTDLSHLLLNRLDYMRVAVSDVDVDQLRGPVNVTPVVGIPEIDPFGAVP